MNKPTMEELKDESMYVLVAPDGVAQVSTMAPDFAMCVALINMMSDAGYSKPANVLFENGFKVLPVRVTITQDGDENKAFENAKSL